MFLALGIERVESVVLGRKGARDAVPARVPSQSLRRHVRCIQGPQALVLGPLLRAGLAWDHDYGCRRPYDRATTEIRRPARGPGRGG